jgi:predicted ATP-dependent endonuclease of OLD family
VGIIIKGFGIECFRSFHKGVQYVGPLEKMNIIIGENNSGKSNVSRFVRKVIHPLSHSGKLTLSGDLPQGIEEATRAIPFLVHFEDLLSLFKDPGAIRWQLEVFTSLFRPSAPEGYVWCWLPTDGRGVSDENFDFSRIQEINNNNLICNLWTCLTGHSGGSLKQHWVPDLLRKLQDVARQPFEMETISATRRLGSRMTEFQDEYGSLDTESNLIETLSSYDRPDYMNRSDNERFRKIERFLQQVLRDSEIKIEIPSSKKTINVRQHGRFLPLEALGTGVHQAVLLAATATVAQRKVILLEEPELHFHPELQRQLMHYLYRETDNQYFITSHSAQVMDAVPCHVINVSMNDGQSRVSFPVSSQQKREVCHQLGYRPSDLLQANSVIWVEGPSDRVYLNHWISKVAPELDEGWHYSVMFYGGRLLSHIAAEDEQADDEFIQLLPINRFPAILIDSDRRAGTQSINSTKQRLIEEMNEIGGFAWVTEGREVENYVNRSEREAAIKSVHPSFVELSDGPKKDKFGHPLKFVNNKGKQVADGINKVAIARAVAKGDPDLDRFDLRNKVEGLVAFIKRANQLD